MPDQFGIPEVDWSQQPGLLGGLTRLYQHLMGQNQVGNVPQQGIVNAQEFNPVSQAAQTAQAISSPGQHKLDLALMAAPLVAGGIGRALTRMPELPTTSLEMPGEYNPSKHTLNEIINARDSVYHATDLRGFNGILDNEAIHPYGAAGKASYYGIPDPGVSVSRVPRVASKGSKAVSFVIDPAEAPKMRPFTEPEYQKTTKVKGVSLMNNFNDAELNQYNDLLGKASNGSLSKKEFDSWMSGKARKYGYGEMNKQFEYENRTFNQSIPLKNLKGVIVDKRALTRDIRNDPEGYWPSHVPEPAYKEPHIDSLVDYHLGQMKQAAQSKGLPFKVAEDGRQLHSYRAGFSKLPKSTPLWAAGATAAGLTTQPQQEQ